MVRDFRIKNYASNSDVYRRHIVSKAEDFTEIRKIIGYGEGEDSESGQTPESGKKSGSGASGAETPETIKKHIDNHEFIVPESDTRVLTQNEIAVLVSAGYYKDETVVQWAINEIYAKMQQIMTAAGYENYFIGTVEAEPSVDDVLALVQAGSYERVVLRPMMIVAGDHANNDMAGDEEDSWKSVFEAAGYDVECVLQGLGQSRVIQQMFVQHTADAIAKLG